MQHREEHETMPIAIVGMGCRLPGGASTPEKLWDLLAEKKSARKEFPSDRLNIDSFYHPNGDKNGTMNNRAGHFLEEDISAFDAPFFSISPAEALSMDPMQRILLEVVYEAMETGGIPTSALAGTQTSCYVGCFTSDYDQIAKRDPETLPKYHATGTGQAILSNRISYCFDLKGPSVTLDTACSSSLVALHLACQSLRTGESKTAIVGATHAILNPDIMVGMTNLHFLSPDSTCYTFDSRANGYARGEGMAALILKPLSDAVRDGDTVRAVIRGSAVNSNGKGSGITLPSRTAQVSLIQAAYEQAGCDPSVTGYVEAHGTGTAAGDPLEAGAIGDALGQHRNGGDKLCVGSIKTNIGHLEGASGLAAIVKTVMSLEKGLIAPNLWFEKGNPAIDFDAWRIRVPTEVVPWPSKGIRRASVNGFGYGGTNSHIIIDDAYHYMRERGIQGKHQTLLPSGSDTDSVESWDSLSSQIPRPAEYPRAFVLSAKESTSVVETAKALAGHLESTSPENEQRFLDNMAFTLSERRSVHDYGATVVASSTAELIEGLRSISTSERRSTSKPHVDFVFTGQGAQWHAMGRELIRHPVVAQSLESCNKAIQSLGASWSIVEELSKEKKTSRINEAEISQPICSAVQIALVDLYTSWEITPRSVIGHSSGEIAAAYATGALTLQDAMCAAFFRGLLSSKIKTLGFKGGMMAAGLSEKEALEEIEAMGETSGKIVVACVNSPRSVTLSGDLPALNQMQKILTPRSIFARKLEVETAYHSHHMLALADEYRQSMANLNVVPWEKRNTVKMFSSVTGEMVNADTDLGSEYWVSNMVSCVRFSDALTSLCRDQIAGKPTGNEIGYLIEIGPHAALAGPIKQVLSHLSDSPGNEIVPIKYLSVLTRGKDAWVTALTAAATLRTVGYPVNMHTANYPYGTPSSGFSVLTDLPTYHWNRSRKYWSESRLSKDHRFRAAPRTDLLGAPSNDWNPFQPRWRNFIRLNEQPWVRSHVVQGAIVYPAAGFCCMALEAAAQLASGAFNSDIFASKNRKVAEYSLRDIVISRALLVPDTEDGVEVVFSLLPSTNSQNEESEFRVFSYTAAAGWSEHCHGYVSVSFRDSDSSARANGEEKSRLQDARDMCKASIAREQLYKHLDTVGLYYGPEFQGITDVSAGSNHALGTVQVTDTAAGMPNGSQFPHLIHPATLDTFLQLSIVALSLGDIENLTQPYVPTAINELRVSGETSLSNGHDLQVAAESRLRGSRHALATVSVVDNSGNEIVQMENIKLSAIASSSSSNVSTDIPSHTAVVAWQPDIDLLSRPKLNAVLRESIESRPLPRADYELLAYHFFERVLKEVDVEEVKNMHSHHQKFFHYMQHQHDMVQSDDHEQQNAEWADLHTPQMQIRMKESIERLSSDPSDYEGRMFARIGEALPSILRKEVEPLALMMEDNLLHDYYTVALGMDGTYPQIARYIQLLSHKYPNLDYLEIGAGTGGATVPVLQALSGTSVRKYPRMKSYTYTDISTGFFEQAMEKFSQWGERMSFAKLDIEQDPKSQPGFQDRQFDVIIAANVLHATYDMYATMKHARSLLRPGGKLVLIDMTHSVMSVSLIFGTLPGWWHCSEPWRTYGPLLNESQWRSVLRETGFSDFDASSPDVLSSLEEQTRVMVATAIEAPPKVSAQSNNDEGKYGSVTKALLLLPDSPKEFELEMIAATQSRLQDAGLAFDSCTLGESSIRDLSSTAIVSFSELGSSILANISPNDLAALQRAILDSAGLIWVTRGSTHTKGTRPELSLFHGMARSLRAERESTTCVSIDLEVESNLPVSDAADLVFSAFQQNFSSDLPRYLLGTADREFSEQAGVLQIKRAIENESLNRLIAHRATGTSLLPVSRELVRLDGSLKAHVRHAGDLDSVVWIEQKNITDDVLPDDEVEIDVLAVGLNAQDVRNCMGEVVDNDEIENNLGSECAGVVQRVGNSVRHVAIGDQVVAWGKGVLSTTARVSGAFVAKIPSSLSFTDAAALPLAYVAAYYGLSRVASVQKEDFVLVNGAETSEGAAAVSIAKNLGATVIATVHEEEHKLRLTESYGLPETHVIFASSKHDTNLTNSVTKLTNHHGVDTIFNASVSAGGNNLTHSLTKLIAPFGRYLQCGSSTQPANLPNNTSYTSIDISRLYTQAPSLASSIFSECFSEVAIPTQISTLPVHTFSSVSTSLRLLQSNTHTKTILVKDPHDSIPVLPAPLHSAPLSGDATYLLVGGFGGLGRSIARRLASQGAQNLLFVSRSGASSPEARTLLHDLNSCGIRTEVIACDITHTTKFSGELDSVLSTMPPLRGVIQGAMLLQDSIFTNMTHESWTKCLAPKVQGSYSLHSATLDHGPLDFFIMLSSCASFWGNAGQANYVAGCEYQVSLAAHRRSLGLAGCAIDVGKIVNVGFVAENTGTVSERNLVRLGLLDVSEEEFLAILDTAMAPGSDSHIVTGASSYCDGTDGREMPFFARDPVLSHMDFVRARILKSPSSNTMQAGTATSTALAPLPTLLSAAEAGAEATQYVLAALQQKLSRALMMSLADLDPQKSLAAYGVDSLVAVELRNWVAREAKAELAVFDIVQAPSLLSLAGVVADRSGFVPGNGK